MKNFSIAICLSIFSCFASANAFICGDSQSTVMNSSKSGYPYIVVSAFTKDYAVNHKFHASYMYFSMQCVEDVKGKKYLFIKTNAGGSGSLDNFSLIDTTNGQLVVTSESKTISPEERRLGLKTDNYAEVLKILKLEPKAFTCQPREQTEEQICLVSAVELG